MSSTRSLHSFSHALLLCVASATGADARSENVQDLQHSLVAHSASDFASSASRPDQFRNVDHRYRENVQGARTYMLCGEARMVSGAKSDWVDFATIKTAPYEQWIGGAATDMCGRAVPISLDGTDLSVLLQAELAIARVQRQR